MRKTKREPNPRKMIFPNYPFEGSRLKKIPADEKDADNSLYDDLLDDILDTAFDWADEEDDEDEENIPKNIWNFDPDEEWDNARGAVVTLEVVDAGDYLKAAMEQPTTEEILSDIICNHFALAIQPLILQGKAPFKSCFLETLLIAPYEDGETWIQACPDFIGTPQSLPALKIWAENEGTKLLENALTAAFQEWMDGEFIAYPQTTCETTWTDWEESDG